MKMKAKISGDGPGAGLTGARRPGAQPTLPEEPMQENQSDHRRRGEQRGGGSRERRGEHSESIEAISTEKALMKGRISRAEQSSNRELRKKDFIQTSQGEIVTKSPLAGILLQNIDRGLSRLKWLVSQEIVGSVYRVRKNGSNRKCLLCAAVYRQAHSDQVAAIPASRADI